MSTARHRPSAEEVRRRGAGYDLVPVYRRLTADALTPVTAYTALADDGPSFLFESVVGGERIGRYSVLGSAPTLTLSARGTNVTVEEGGESRTFEAADPLDELEMLMATRRAARIPGLPRFCGGAVGYLGYDTVRYVEDLPSPPADDRGLPDLRMSLYDRMVVFDHLSKTVFAVAHAQIDAEDPDAEYRRACDAVDELVERLRAAPRTAVAEDIDPAGDATVPASNFARPDFEAAVRACKEYIRAGDVFQVVLSQRFRRQTTADPPAIYRALRVVNPSPFMFLLRGGAGEETLVGASPEIMVRVEEVAEADGSTDREITIRPLAGTRRRGATPAEDAALADELLADPKERAEHVMLIDLARNDVGRVAEFGSVRLADVMQVERYSHVMHITSNVTGRLKPNLSPLDALRSGLPAGTVSGAPKVRAMEIIDELEPHRRGPYGGAVGYLDFAGGMDTCIALRTMVVRGNTVDVQAGAGLVADSDPAKEYEETVAKATGLLRAIDIAERQLSAS